MHISDWKSHVFSSALLDFTYQTLLYASCSRGYKAGGINPPTPGYATGEDLVEAGYISQEALDNDGKFFDFYPVLYLTSVNYEPTFDPEFVNAFEIGMKRSEEHTSEIPSLMRNSDSVLCLKKKKQDRYN